MMANNKAKSGIDINKRSTVNPLLSMLFMRMCFSTWNKFSELYMDRIKNVKSKIITLQEFMVITSDEETDDEEAINADDNTDEMKAQRSPDAIEEEDETQENENNFEGNGQGYKIYNIKRKSNDLTAYEAVEEGDDGIFEEEEEEGMIQEEEKCKEDEDGKRRRGPTRGSVPLPDTNQYETDEKNGLIRKDSIEQLEALIEADENKTIKRKSIFSSTTKDIKKEPGEKGEKFGGSRPNSNQIRSNVVNLNIQNNILINNNFFFGSHPQNIDEETLAMLALQGNSSRNTSKKSSEKLDDFKPI